MSLCVTPLTPVCVKELQRVTARVSDADLATLAATDSVFKSGGFRVGKPALLRARLEQIVCGGPVVSDTLRRVVAKRSRAYTLMQKLGEDALLEMRHALAALLGQPVVQVALLLDSRQSVRAKAETWLTDPNAFLPVDPIDAVTQLRACFGDLYELLGKPSGQGDAPAAASLTPEKWQEQKERYELRVRELQDENRRLHAAEGQLAQATLKLSKLEGGQALLEERLETREAELKAKREEAENYRVELLREISHRDERADAEIDLRLSKEFFGWLQDARKVEKAVHNLSASEDVLARADAALKRQAEEDRNSGNRLAMEERLDALRAKKERVDATLRNAIRQSPELKEAEVSLHAAIDSLASLLNPDRPASPMEEALLTRIHAASDNDLPSLRTLPDFIASLRILPEAGVARLREAFQKRLAAAQAVGLSAETSLSAKPRGKLGTALSGHLPAILLIDGHNTLFGMPTRYNPARGQSLTEAEKREMLVKDVVKLVSPNPALRAWVVFDGPTHNDSSATQNVRVSYSGGQGEHRADRILLDNIRFFKSAAKEETVLLVSNDHDLCTEAKRLGADTIPVLEFGSFLPSTVGF